MTDTTDNAEALVAAIAERLLARGQWLGTAESCTGGLIAAWLTDRPGSSGWFERGVVTYTNRAKHELLGVPLPVFETQGAVSAACVAAMAEGLLARAPLHWALSISGIAGPGGGTPDKPVGTVWFGWATHGQPAQTQMRRFDGDRQAVRHAAALHALRGLLDRLA